MNLIIAKKLPLKNKNYVNALLIPCSSFIKWSKDILPEVTEYDMLSFEIIIPQKRNFIIVGPAIGSPAIILILERLIISGIKNIIVFGTCGSICKEAKIGDIILPTSAISEEGTSKLYCRGEVTSPLHYHPSPFLLDTIEKKFVDNNIKYKKGAIWTTDAPYRETLEKVKNFQNKGAIGVDMELSAIFAVGNLKKINVASILIVSDELHSNTWKTGFKSKILKETFKKVFNILDLIFNQLK
jgi:purine-nucleoside phosphorylase